MEDPNTNDFTQIATRLEIVEKQVNALGRELTQKLERQVGEEIENNENQMDGRFIDLDKKFEFVERQIEHHFTKSRSISQNKYTQNEHIQCSSRDIHQNGSTFLNDFVAGRYEGQFCSIFQI